MTKKGRVETLEQQMRHMAIAGVFIAVGFWTPGWAGVLLVLVATVIVANILIQILFR